MANGFYFFPALFPNNCFGQMLSRYEFPQKVQVALQPQQMHVYRYPL